MRISGVLTLTLAAIATVAHAGDKSPPPISLAQPSSNPAYPKSYDFTSDINGESYRVLVYVPRGPVPEAGFPTLYVLDGGNLFGTFANAVSNQGSVGEAERAVVIGIEGADGKNGADRTYDFTPFDLTPDEKKIMVDLGDNPRFGGYEMFFRVIQDEIKPRVARLAEVDSERDMLFGWSLGGQFVVHTMLVHPEAYSTYIALSPSLYRSDKAVFREIPQFKRTVAATGRRLSLWIGAGSLEQERSPGMTKWPVDQDAFTKELTYANIVGNLLDFSAQVRPFFRERCLRFASHIFDSDTHNTVPWSAINPVLRFALPGGQDAQVYASSGC